MSPNRAQAQQPRRNRDALRNYYNIKKAEEAKSKEDDTSSEFSVNDHALSDVVESELDGENFDADAFVQNALVNQGLGELLKTYGSILSGINSLPSPLPFLSS